MSSPAYLAQPNIQRLPSLLREVQEGEIRVPHFQRPFVWTDEQRLDLFRSLYEGIPIGSILIWRTRNHALQCYDRLGSLKLNWSIPLAEEQAVRQYVLDGHQRLTTLFDALGAGLVHGEHSGDSLSPLEFEASSGDRPKPIFFDLETRAFCIPRRKSDPSETWLPLSILLDPFKLFDLQKRLLERGRDRALVNRAEALANTFKDYTIPVVPIVTESLELATQSFQRVNSGGTKMTEVHMVSALTWSKEFDLNERIREIQSDLGEVGWEDLGEQMVFNTCKAILDLDLYDSDAKEIRRVLQPRPEVLDESRDALKQAARFLRDACGVYGPATLPYSFQIVLLADVFHRVSPASSELKALLQRWFWQTTYLEHFGGISAGRLQRTLIELREIAQRGALSTPWNSTFVVSSAPRRFDFRTARSRALALRMADLQKPSEEQGGHDPNQTLAEHGGNALPMLLTRRDAPGVLLEGPENRILVHPSLLPIVRMELSFEGFNPEDRTSTKAIHAMSSRAMRALAEKNFGEFLRLRREELLGIEENFVQNLGLRYDRS